MEKFRKNYNSKITPIFTNETKSNQNKFNEIVKIFEQMKQEFENGIKQKDNEFDKMIQEERNALDEFSKIHDEKVKEVEERIEKSILEKKIKNEKIRTQLKNNIEHFKYNKLSLGKLLANAHNRGENIPEDIKEKLAVLRGQLKQLFVIANQMDKNVSEKIVTYGDVEQFNTDVKSIFSNIDELKKSLGNVQNWGSLKEVRNKLKTIDKNIAINPTNEKKKERDNLYKQFKNIFNSKKPQSQT